MMRNKGILPFCNGFTQYSSNLSLSEWGNSLAHFWLPLYPALWRDFKTPTKLVTLYIFPFLLSLLPLFILHCQHLMRRDIYHHKLLYSTWPWSPTLLEFIWETVDVNWEVLISKGRSLAWGLHRSPTPLPLPVACWWIHWWAFRAHFLLKIFPR